GLDGPARIQALDDEVRANDQGLLLGGRRRRQGAGADRQQGGGEAQRDEVTGRRDRGRAHSHLLGWSVGHRGTRTTTGRAGYYDRIARRRQGRPGPWPAALFGRPASRKWHETVQRHGDPIRERAMMPAS